MNYSQEIYREAQQILEERRTEANQRASALRERMCARYPRVREIEAEMAETSSLVIRAVLGNAPVEREIEQIKTRNLALQEELRQLLAQAGETARDFEPRFFCEQCKDTGYTQQGLCRCHQVLLKEIACRRLCEDSAMRPASFEELKLAYYPDTAGEDAPSPRQRMEGVITYCKRYAEDFSLTSPSLLLRGPTGTGKTHVSLAIARRAAEQGYHVVYGPVQKLLRQLEREHFGRDEGESEELLCHCDLLILDDLGAEFASPFYASCLYTILNARLLQQLPTIISTNLNMQQIQERYGDAIASRVMGSFQPLPFCGKDIRQLKLQANLL